MTISRAIIDDLYPLYSAGEASADTRALVEEYLVAHPDAAATLPVTPSLPAIDPPPDLEVRALKRTTRLLEQRGLFGAAALSMSCAPVAIGFIEQGKLHLVYQDLPWVAGLLYAGALGLWIRFFQACRQVQAAGLLPRRTWTARFVWLFCGTVVGAAISVPVQYWTQWGRAMTDVPMLAGLVALGIGERLGQLATPAQITRPTTVFGPHDDADAE